MKHRITKMVAVAIFAMSFALPSQAFVCQGAACARAKVAANKLKQMLPVYKPAVQPPTTVQPPVYLACNPSATGFIVLSGLPAAECEAP